MQLETDGDVGGIAWKCGYNMNNTVESYTAKSCLG